MLYCISKAHLDQGFILPCYMNLFRFASAIHKRKTSRLQNCVCRWATRECQWRNYSGSFWSVRWNCGYPKEQKKLLSHPLQWRVHGWQSNLSLWWATLLIMLKNTRISLSLQVKWHAIIINLKSGILKKEYPAIQHHSTGMHCCQCIVCLLSGSLSGYRIRIGSSTDKKDSGRIHVDFAQARDDLYEWECKQRLLAREERHRRKIQEDRLRPPSPPPIMHYSEHEATILSERLKGMLFFLSSNS